MAIDFRADQVQVRQIIAKGGLANNLGAKLVVYPIEAQNTSNPNFGLINQNAFNTGSLDGQDIFLFVSGGVGERGTTNRSITVFGGDIHISGNLSIEGTSLASTLQEAYNEGPAIDVGSGFIQITGSSGTPFGNRAIEILNENASAGIVFTRTDINTTIFDLVGARAGQVDIWDDSQANWVVQSNNNLGRFLARSVDDTGLAYTFTDFQTIGVGKTAASASSDQNHLVLQTINNKEIVIRGNTSVPANWPFKFFVGNATADGGRFTSFSPVNFSSSLDVAGGSRFFSGLSGALNYLVDGTTPFITSSGDISVGLQSNGQYVIGTSGSFPTRLFLAAFKLTTTESDNPQVVGAGFFNPAEHRNTICSLRSIISTDSGANEAFVQMYNVTDDLLVEIGGVGVETLSASNTEPTLVQSVNLFGATGFSSGSAIYEIRVYGGGSSNNPLTTHFSTEMVCE